MAPLTIYLSRLICVLTLIAALSMLADKPQAIDTVRAVVQDRPVLFILGMLGTAAGLAVALGHQVWSGGVLPVLVTAIGWVVLIRGAILLFLSQHATARLVDWFRFEEFFYLSSDLLWSSASISPFAGSAPLPQGGPPQSNRSGRAATPSIRPTRTAGKAVELYQ
jgi:hypothetical protein